MSVSKTRNITYLDVMFWKVAQNVIDMTEIIDGDEQSPTIIQESLKPKRS